MRFLHRCLFVCVWGMALPCLGVADSKSDETDKALEVLSKSLNSRREIKSFNAKVHVRYSKDGISFSEREYHLIRDGEKQRFFFDLPMLSEEYVTGFSEDKGLLAILEIGKDSQSLKTALNPKVHIDIKLNNCLTIDQTSSQLAGGRKRELVFPQFEYFGYSPKAILSYRYNDFGGVIERLPSMGRNPDSFISVSDINYDSQTVLDFRINTFYNNKTRKRIHRSVFDPSKKLLPVFVEDSFAVYNTEKKEFLNVGPVDTISSTPALHTESGCWYPAKWTYERRENGKITTKEEVSVELISLNEPLDPALFTLKGLERLKPDTRVNWLASSPKPPAEGTLLWNGEEIVSGLPGRGLSEPMPRSNRRLIIVMVNVVILSWILGIHFYRQYRRSHK